MDVREIIRKHLGEDVEEALHSSTSPERYLQSAYDLIGEARSDYEISPSDVNNDVYDNPSYDEMRNNAQKSLIQQAEGIKVEADDHPCNKCGGPTLFFQLQTRSGDEGMTSFYRCQRPGCNTQFKL